jgi:hypothetical protein
MVLICITITILGIIHRPVFYLKHDVSETEFCLRLEVEPTHLGPIDPDWNEREELYLLGQTEYVPGRWIMSRIEIAKLTYHPHKPTDLVILLTTWISTNLWVSHITQAKLRMKHYVYFRDKNIKNWNNSKKRIMAFKLKYESNCKPML